MLTLSPLPGEHPVCVFMKEEVTLYSYLEFFLFSIPVVLAFFLYQ